ncbi:hypothetical protein AXG93_3217s1100 [Marchantia polymorpha subsp. ruderalis]|uniref:GHMP kinase N-terminal domain-containing protein n=1 Tax=Marchantia polymorpha subsp. ruderalis TaxID=1480154 RepID=A0A176VWA9_MARPO|nr:hypothetical protein AXG93_3217s1100 [Marchantia polymorpha subsp. ruderalis]
MLRVKLSLRVLTVESGGKAGGFQNSETMDAESARRIEQRAYARVGFLGNPSDAYFGKTISFSLANFYATVVLEPSPTIRFLPHAVHDPCEFGSLQQMVTCVAHFSSTIADNLVYKPKINRAQPEKKYEMLEADRIRGEGYYGGVRLLMAACKVFFDVFKHAVDGKGNSLHDRGFTLSYDTNIPRQTGLSGSSAIVWAALKCLLEYFDIPTKQAQVDGLPSLILRVEEELGITAGLQDRVVQVYGGLVYMDFDKTSMESQKKGIYTAMDPELLPPLYLIYCKNPSDSGKACIQSPVACAV